jgi:hypothetical protein
MYLKNGFYVLLCSLLLTGLISCLKGINDDLEYIISDDAQIISFSIAHDSVSVLAKTKFSIDQTKERGKIYNQDSLPYLTDIYEKVVVTYTTGSGVSTMMTLVDGDTVWVKNNDSLDVSNPVQLTLYAPSGKKKDYELAVNIHQIDPDSVRYTQVSTNEFLAHEYKIVQLQGIYYAFVRMPAPPVSGLGSVIALYQSTDMKNWEFVRLNGFPENIVIEGIQAKEINVNGKYENRLYAYTESGELYVSLDDVAYWNKVAARDSIVSILGYLKPLADQREKERVGGVAFIEKKGATLVFTYTEDLVEFNDKGETVPENFPVSGFSVINNKYSGEERITLVGGKSQSGENLNTVWTTEDGMYWVNLSSDPQGNLPVVEGGAFAYNNEIWFAGGKNIEDGTYNKKIYYSLDGGLVWKAKEAKAQFPAALSSRTNAPVIVDNQGIYFYIVGGKNQSALTDSWKGVLNSRTFAH